MSLHYIIGKEFTSSILLRILSIFQSRVEIMRMPQPTRRYLILWLTLKEYVDLRLLPNLVLLYLGLKASD